MPHSHRIMRTSTAIEMPGRRRSCRARGELGSSDGDMNDKTEEVGLPGHHEAAIALKSSCIIKIVYPKKLRASKPALSMS